MLCWKPLRKVFSSSRKIILYSRNFRASFAKVGYYEPLSSCIIKQPLNFGRFGFLPVSENDGNSARLGPFLPDPNFSAMSYFHTWSLLPHHIKSSNLQQFLPVKVQTLLCCYIKSRWWHERDNREHLPMWSSSCQHPQPQSLGHTKENHLKISLTEKHFYTPCSNVEQGLMKKNLIH